MMQKNNKKIEKKFNILDRGKKILFLFFIIFFPNTLLCEERIIDYKVLIQVNKDSVLDVIEQITVNVEGKNIRRGLVRYLPLKGDVKYKLEYVKRNNKIEPNFIENYDNSYIINTGDNSFLPINTIQTFTIKYKVYNALKFKDNFAELYWNASGNDWIFNIDKISVKVILPKEIKIFENSAYVGKYGSKEKGLYEEDIFYSPRKLNKGEGFTIVKTFDRNYIENDKQNEKLNLIYINIFFTIIMLMYYILSYFFLKISNSTNEVFYPRFDPIKNITAAEAAYIFTKGKENTKFSIVSIFDMTVNKFLKIENIGKEYIISRTGKNPENIEENLFISSCGDILKLSGNYDREAENFNKKINDNLSDNFSTGYINNNNSFFIGGILLFVFLIGISLILNDKLHIILNIHHKVLYYISYIIQFIAKWYVVIILLHLIIIKISSIKNKNLDKVKTIFLLFLFILFMENFIELNDYAVLSNNLFVFISLFMIILSRNFLKTFTYNGNEIVNHLKGLRLFIKTTDITNRNSYNLDEMEKLIPYAIIFNLEKQWSEKLIELMKISNYSGENTNFYNDFYSFRKFNRLFTQSMINSQKHNGFGFGGRGFSGGGFGGGGGRGR